MKLTYLLAIALALPGLAAAQTTVTAPVAFNCSNCTAWNQPQAPFRIYGNTWYVGTRELSALLVTSPQGHVLLDGALPQSAPLIAANIKALGFRLQDVKLILNSHAHFDHAGGIAALQQASGAQVLASAHGAQVLMDGVIGKDDAQYQPDEDPRIPAVAAVRAVADGETIRAGKLAITAHLTPGHTPGSTSWTWTSCEGKRCLSMVYADSLTAVSAEGYRFSDATTVDVATFRASIAKVGALQCDVVVSTHPGFTRIMEKRAQRSRASNPFIDRNGCRDYAAAADARFTARLAAEQNKN